MSNELSKKTDLIEKLRVLHQPETWLYVYGDTIYRTAKDAEADGVDLDCDDYFEENVLCMECTGFSEGHTENSFIPNDGQVVYAPCLTLQIINEG